TGIQITGGSLTANGSTGSGVSIINFSSSGWKGILLSGGSLTLTTSSIQKGGKSTFAGQTETAAITVTGGTLPLTGGNTVTASTGYDILITSMSTSSTIFANSLS